MGFILLRLLVSSLSLVADSSSSATYPRAGSVPLSPLSPLFSIPGQDMEVDYGWIRTRPDADAHAGIE